MKDDPVGKKTIDLVELTVNREAISQITQIVHDLLFSEDKEDQQKGVDFAIRLLEVGLTAELPEWEEAEQNEWENRMHTHPIKM